MPKRAGVLLVWCNRPRTRVGRLDSGPSWELRQLAQNFHYLCSLDYSELGTRGFTKTDDPRVMLERCSVCLTDWYGPSLSELKARPSGKSGLAQSLA